MQIEIRGASSNYKEEKAKWRCTSRNDENVNKLQQ
jgi:hypothetical protein